MNQVLQKNREALELFQRALDHYDQDEYGAALPLFEQSLALNHTLANLEAVAMIHLYIGQVTIALDDPERARREFTAAYNLLRDLGDKAGQAQALLELGELALEMGDHVAAEAHFREVVALLAGDIDAGALARAHTRLGHLAFERDDLLAARRHYEQALGYYDQTGDVVGTAGVTIELANCLQEEDPDRSRRLFETGRDLAQSAGNDYLASVAIHGLGVLYAESDDWEAARRCYQTALDLKERVDDRLGQAFAYLALGAAEQALGRISAARSAWQVATTLAEEEGLDQIAALAREELAGIGLDDDWRRD
jgi:tetratricopeptide (TPR) repeat protein